MSTLIALFVLLANLILKHISITALPIISPAAEVGVSHSYTMYQDEDFQDIVIIDPFEVDWETDTFRQGGYVSRYVSCWHWYYTTTSGRAWDEYDEDYIEDLHWDVRNEGMEGYFTSGLAHQYFNMLVLGGWLIETDPCHTHWLDVWAWWCQGMHSTSTEMGFHWDTRTMEQLQELEEMNHRLWCKVAMWDAWGEEERMEAGYLFPSDLYMDDDEWRAYQRDLWWWYAEDYDYYDGWYEQQDEEEWLAWWQAQQPKAEVAVQHETEDEMWERRTQVRVGARLGMKGAYEKGMWQDRAMRTQTRYRVHNQDKEFPEFEATYWYHKWPAADIADWLANDKIVSVQVVEHHRPSPRKPRRKHKVVDHTQNADIWTKTSLADSIVKREQEEEMWDNAPVMLKCVGQLKYNWEWPTSLLDELL